MHYLFMLFMLSGLLLSSCADTPLPTEEENKRNEKPVIPPMVPETGTGLPQLYVDGRYLKNNEGQVINLHGFAQTYSPYFNQNAWGNHDVAGCLRYNKMMIDGILSAGWKMNFVRMHMDPYWSDDPSKASVRYEGHERFSITRFKKYLDELFIPMATYANDKGLYVVFRPPGVAPGKIAVGDDYNLFLEEVWSTVSAHPKIKNNPGIMFELANEPINILGPDGTYASNGQGHFDRMKSFCQRIVDKIRANADNNIIWVPGLAYQSSFSGYTNNPVEGNNIGYAVHAYPGWYGSDTEEASPELGGTMGGGYESFQRGWNTQIKPVADFAPVMVTEMDWAPKKYEASWGKSFTGSLGGPGFGANFKYIADMTGNVSWLLFTECHRLAAFNNAPGTPGQYTFLNDPEACPWPIYHWFKEYAAGGSGTDAILQKLEIVGVDHELQILTGGERYLITVGTFADGFARPVTADTRFHVSDESIIRVTDKGMLHALKDGSATVTATYTSQGGITREKAVTIRATTFPLTAAMFNPSIFGDGSFDEETNTLITGQWGFGGWWYNKGVDLSSYHYLVAELDNDNESGVSFRLFDENNYWSPPALYDFGSGRRVTVDLHNMYKQVGSQKVKLNPSHIYIIGFWSSGNKPIVIKNVYLTDNPI
ncbi:MAG: glycoside hydrolase family 5 protein [Porphyromonadaceae bacterium]|nr:glycoside hydrolase family 5 protein [Porphyromonadaceae bacterium]